MQANQAAQAVKEVSKHSGFLIAMGILSVIVGMLAIGSPLYAGAGVAMFVGIMLLVSGISELLLAVRARSWGVGIMTFLFGGLTVIAGLWLLVRPLSGVLVLTLALAIYFVVDGVCRCLSAFQMRPLSGWGWALFGGIVSVLLGFLIWRQWPLSGAWAIGVLAGVRILFSGWSMIALGAAGRSAATEAQSTT